MSFWSIYELFLEGIEDDTVGRAGGAPGNPDKEKARQEFNAKTADQRRKEAAQAFRGIGKAAGAATTEQEPQHYQTGRKYAGHEKESENASIIPSGIPYNASLDQIMKMTKGRRNKQELTTFDAWLAQIQEKVLYEYLYKHKREDGDKYDSAIEVLESALEEYKDWLKNVYDAGHSWDEALEVLITKRLGNNAGPYLNPPDSENFGARFKRRLGKEIQDEVRKEYMAQRRQQKHGGTQFTTPAEKTMRQKYFQDFMRDEVPKALDAYRVKYDENDLKQLAYFLSTPTPEGPMFKVLSKDESGWSKIITQMRKIVDAHKNMQHIPSADVDASDPRNKMRSDPNDPNASVVGKDVSALAIPSPDMKDVFTKKTKFKHVPDERKKRKFTSAWDLGFTGDIPFSRM